jgi:hypothetical protein
MISIIRARFQHGADGFAHVVSVAKFGMMKVLLSVAHRQADALKSGL